MLRAVDTLPVSIVKRDGGLMPFDAFKIREAIRKAAQANPEDQIHEEDLDLLTSSVLTHLSPKSCPTVEHVQDLVEEALIDAGYAQTAKAYILYRADHAKRREATNDLMGLYKEITFTDAVDIDLKRENANIDANTAMGTMLKYGSESSKYFVDQYILPEEMEEAHTSGDIHIHDKDFYMLTETCCQIDLTKLFEGGFSTGHGYLRKPKSIQSYAALACIAIQANQNEMHGGQAVPNFDYAMAPGVLETWKKSLQKAMGQTERQLEILFDRRQSAEDGQEASDSKAWPQLFLENYEGTIDLAHKEEIGKAFASAFVEQFDGLSEAQASRLTKTAVQIAYDETDKATYQAMEALIHNLNTMNSRAGAQVPFSSLNYGTDVSEEGRMVMRNLLEATRKGLGNGETPIFPVQIFKVKEGVNYNPEDPNYDLFKLSMKTSSERLFPNFSFLDAPFNLQYYKEGDPNTEVAYMGCRTRVMGNAHDRSRETTFGRGNLSFTSINLPRLGIEAHGDIDAFFDSLDDRIELVIRQLLHRFRIQCAKTVRNYPFLMGQGIWIDSDQLDMDDTVAEVLKHGTLTIGFIGLAETLKALTGKHHGESAESQKLGLAIIGHMRHRCDEASEKYKLNFSLIATPAEGLSGRFVRLDKEKFGVLPGITDREYYTNSFHIPVYYPISGHEKIALEAPYHAFTNGGHISYIEVDGDVAKNLPAFETIIHCMKENGIGYGSVNHPLDRDPVCGYSGIIGNSCPRCGRTEEEGPKFQRIRRITGYLVGTLDRFNDAKSAEVRDRVKHNL